MLITGDLKKLTKLEKGFAVDAYNEGMSIGQKLEDYIVEKGFEPTPYRGKTMMERVAMKDAARAKGLEPAPTALDIVLKAHDMVMDGPRPDTVGKLLLNTSASVLFPEVISNKVYAGKIRGSIVPFFVAETIVIKGTDFKKIHLEDLERDRQMKRKTRGSEFPTTVIRAAAQSVPLVEYGRTLELDYDALENTPFPIFALMVTRFGLQLGVDESNDLITALLNGDGNSNGLQGGATVTTVSSGAVSKLDIIKLITATTQPYQVNVCVARKTYAQLFWDALSDMQNPATQWAQTGLPLPTLHMWEDSTLTSDLILGVDKTLTAAKITNDLAMLTEVDRVITRQVTQTVVSTRSCIDILDKNGIGALDCVH